MYSASGAYMLWTISLTCAYSEPRSTTSGVARGALPKLPPRASLPLTFILAIASVTTEKFFKFNLPGCCKSHIIIYNYDIYLFVVLLL